MEETNRPWGKYLKFHQETGVWVKRIEVNPKSRLSLQKHQYRSEKWIVVAGEGMAKVDDTEIPLFVGSVIDVPLGSIHRLTNPSSDKILVVIEVACGEYLGEDDIIRLEDDYERKGT